MKKHLLVASATALLVGLLVPAVSAQLQAGPPELRPVATELDQPQQAAAGNDNPNTYGQRAVTPPAAVDAQTYAREKAAAERGPAPTGASTVTEPGGPPAAPSQAPTVSSNFAGLTRPSAASHGFVFTPPDTILGKSPNRYLEGTNSALRLFDGSGSTLATADLNTFFGASTASGILFDPKVFYDRNAGRPRMFVVALQEQGDGDTNAANNISRIHLAISRASDPAGLTSASWCRYNIDGRRNVGTTNVSWADYPEIGVGNDSLSIATNNFRFTDGGFTYAMIHVFNKVTAENNATACPTIPRFDFQPSSTIGNFAHFTIQPAQQYTANSSFTGTTNPAYYMSTTRGSSNAYHVYRVRNVASGSPTLQSVTLTGGSYGIPPSSPQPSSTVQIDTGDNRMLQVGGIGNNLVGIFTTVCNFTSGTANESCNYAPRMTVGQNASGGLTATLPEDTLAGFGNNIFVHHSSIATNTALASGSNWESSGTGRYLRSNAIGKNVNAGWTGGSAYAPGSCSLPSSLNRSGDYSGAQLAPTDKTNFVLAGEQAVVTDGSCQWRTRIAVLTP
jgi:hypothetical protein